MDYEKITIGFHLVGFALGLGGATISDIIFFQALHRKLITEDRFALLMTISKIVWTGLLILIVSGATLFALIYAEQGSLPLLNSPRWQAKLTLVAIVLINGLFFRFSIFPRLKAITNQPLSISNIGPSMWKLAISGSISIASWYGIMIISLLPRTVRPPYWEFMGIYIVIVLAGILIGKILVARTVKSN